MRRLPSKMSPGLALSLLDRAVKEHFGQRCTSADRKLIADYFLRDGALKCIYCGAVPTRWDHYHPVSLGGDTGPGNLLPACGSCDDSKGKKTLEELARGKGKHRPNICKLPRISAEVRAYQRRCGHTNRSSCTHFRSLRRHSRLSRWRLTRVSAKRSRSFGRT
jgi:hypothetical protein